jgi:TatD DNase family protein
MIDTHCHLTFPQFAGRTGEILAEARKVGVRGAITVATTSADCLAAAALAERHENLWCSAGVHPLHSDEPLAWDDVARAAASPKCVAWGELGLDNHYADPPRHVQDKVLAEELAFIQDQSTRVIDDLRLTIDDSETNTTANRQSTRPIIVHCRDAFNDLLAVFRSAPFEPSRYVFHCFTGTPDDARKVLDFGAWISFTGVVTFQNAREVAEAAKIVPADRILVETDSPFLTPEPVRKVRPNEPKFVVHIAQHLAKIRGVDPLEFEQQLDANAERFFGIRLP